MRRGERGQAMVLVAMMVVVLIGFIGLAVDGGRLYWERRILQNSVDAAGLAASDNYQDSQSVSSSMQSAAREYAANEKIYGTASANPNWSNPSVDVTWTGASDTMHVVYTSAGSVSTFRVSSTHPIPLAFMPVLGVSNSANVKAVAEGHAKAGGTSGLALVTLGTAGCGSSGYSLTVQGSSTAKLTVTGGNVQVNGSVFAAGAGVAVTGNFADNCPSPVPAGVTATGTRTAGAAPITDPGFAPGPLASYSTPQVASTNVVLNPGTYAADPTAGGGSCYFMSPGVYQFNAGISNLRAVAITNSLRPPDEPAWQGAPTNAPNYNTAVASPQYWPSGCSGSFSVAPATTLLPLTAGNWGVIVTSTRTETYPPGSATTYPRESAPSTCRAVAVNGLTQGVQVTINNIPGAQGYNVYMAFGASGNPCATGPWGYVGHLNNPVTEVSGALGTVISPVYDTTVVTSVLTPATISPACRVGATYTFGCAVATGGFGSANPPGDGAETAPAYSGGPPSEPARDIVSAGGGDRANSHDCQPSTSTDSAAPCINAQVTPGAVQAYFPAGTCLKQANGVLEWFSGFQYNNIAVYAPATNTCSVQLAGQVTFGTGTIYWPGGSWTVTGYGQMPIAGQVIVGTLTCQGSGSTTITYDPASAPTQGYSQLSL